jgi:hypothetical protein
MVWFMHLRTKPLCAVLLLGFICASSRSQGQSASDLSAYQSIGNLMLARVRQALRDQSTPADRALQDQIDASIVPAAWVNGVAYQRGGKRYIEITAGMIEIIDWVATAEAMTVAAGHKDCEIRYVNYLGDAIAQNTGLYRDKMQLASVPSPYLFYDHNRPSCPHVTQQDIQHNERANLTRDLVMNESLMQVFAHEVGHHKYNDTASSVPWCEQQKREARADAYSFQVLTGPDQSPLVAIPVLLIFATVEGFSGEDNDQTHPAALKRVLAMMEATRAQINSNSELRSALQKTGRAAEFYRYLDQYESVTKAEIASSPKSRCASEPASGSGASGGSSSFGGVSQSAMAGNGMGDGLKRLIDTRGDFSQFKGSLDPDGDGTEWVSTLTLPGAMSCSVRINRGFNAGQVFTCMMTRTDDAGKAANVFDQLLHSVSDGLPAGWRQDSEHDASAQKGARFRKSSKDPWISLKLSGSRKMSVYFTMFSPDDDD